MTGKQFWQTASNWGFLGGAALFAMNLIGWALKLEANHGWMYELLLFIAICPLIIITGKRNAAAAGPEGYSYGRAVGFVFAMMMFAGVVYGVGRFLMINFIGPEYYGKLNEEMIDALILVYSNFPQFDLMIEQRSMMLGWLSNPFYLIFESVFGLVIKGGFLGLVLCAFVYKKPDIFADTPQTLDDGPAEGDNINEDPENGSE